MVSTLRFKGDPKRPKHKSSKKTGHKIKDPSKIKPSDPHDGWVSASKNQDLNGPAVLALDTEEGVSCICADLEGKAFVSIDLDVLADEPSIIDTVEPKTVQQLFVLTPLSFIEDSSDLFAFKSSAGKFLSVTKSGTVDVNASAIGSSEMFKLSFRDGKWLIKASSGSYLCLREHDSSSSGFEIRSDGDTENKLSRFTLRIQAQNKYVSESSILNTTKISTRELEDRVGRRLTDDEVRRLKQAYKQGRLNEALLDIRVKSKTDTIH